MIEISFIIGGMPAQQVSISTSLNEQQVMDRINWGVGHNELVSFKQEKLSPQAKSETVFFNPSKVDVLSIVELHGDSKIELLSKKLI